MIVSLELNVGIDSWPANAAGASLKSPSTRRASFLDNSEIRKAWSCMGCAGINVSESPTGFHEEPNMLCALLGLRSSEESA